MGVYEKLYLSQISFPLGGIGTGSIGLGGDGRFIEWEIFNRPNKKGLNGFSSFWVKAEKEDKVLDTRILQGDLQPPYTGNGHGPARELLSGMPHFKYVKFIGKYPIARIEYADPNFPGEIFLTAFNPFIPLNDKDSSLPAAFFEIEIVNNTDDELLYTIALVVGNPSPPAKCINSFNKQGEIKYIKLHSIGIDENDPRYGSITIATDSENVSYQEYLYRGRMFDKQTVFWKDFNLSGQLKNRHYEEPGSNDNAALAAHIEVPPYKSKKIRFIISWYYPNFELYWRPKEKTVWKNYYSKMFKDSDDVAVYCLRNWSRLYDLTKSFKDSLFTSTFPQYVIDAISSNLSILKSPTVIRLEDGSFYGFEGCNKNSGCCEGSCMHVWGYSTALAYMFPNLERSMLDTYFDYSQRDDGYMSFRLKLPLGSGFLIPNRAAVDGQYATLIRAYRYWLLTGDTEWLRKRAENIFKAIEYAWSHTNIDRWDWDKDGVIEGRQHNTLDIELFGPNAWLTGFYLAALRIGAEIAHMFGYNEREKLYRKLYENGRKWIDENLFNGEYYIQKIDLKDKSILEKYAENDPQIFNVFWLDEKNEIKYQIGEGCHSDQLLAQWHLNLCGLDHIYNKDNMKKALKSIFKYNFVTMRNHVNPCRVYALNDEKGLVIVNWPDKTKEPTIPILYSQEVFTGIEYSTASLMIMEGLVREGLEIVKAIRERFDGFKRNPWDEFECGHNYSRALASFSLLIALSGFLYNASESKIKFRPVSQGDHFKVFWITGTGWGTFEINNNKAILNVIYGSLKVKEIQIPLKVKKVFLNEKTIDFENIDDTTVFRETITLKEKDKLILEN